MRDVDRNIRSSLERLTSPTGDTSKVDVLWSDLEARRRKRRARKGALAALPLVLVAVLAAGVFSSWGSDRSRSDVAAVGTGTETSVVREVGTAVAYNGITFRVPADLPVSKVGGYDFSCATYTTDGVFLAADAEALTGASCPETTDYARTIHVQPAASEDPGDRAVEGVGVRERWVATIDGDPDGWYEAVLPAYGVMFTFYGLDAEVREAVLASVQRNDGTEEPERTTTTAVTGTPEGTWRLAGVVRDGNRVSAAGDASVTITGDSLTGSDECGNGISTTLVDGTVSDPGLHFLIGCDAVEVNGNAFWDVLGRQATYELREGELWFLGPEGESLIFVSVFQRPAQAVDPADLAIAWTDAEGRELPDGLGEPDPNLVINTIKGPEHCGWEDAVIMHLSMPLGAVTKSSSETRQYVRDPEGVLSRPELTAAFDFTATLPDDAEATGMRNGDVELWVAPSSFDKEVYVGRDGRFEAWPRATELIGCA